MRLKDKYHSRFNMEHNLKDHVVIQRDFNIFTFDPNYNFCTSTPIQIPLETLGSIQWSKLFVELEVPTIMYVIQPYCEHFRLHTQS